MHACWEHQVLLKSNAQMELLDSNVSQLKPYTFAQKIITKVFQPALVFNKVPQEDLAMLQLIISDALNKKDHLDATVIQLSDSENNIYFSHIYLFRS